MSSEYPYCRQMLKHSTTRGKRAGRWFDEQDILAPGRLNGSESQRMKHILRMAKEGIAKFGLHKPIDSSLPRPERYGDTFGYSFGIFCLAAEAAGAQRRAFSLKDIGIIADSGVEMAVERIQAFTKPGMREILEHRRQSYYRSVPIAASAFDDPWMEYRVKDIPLDLMAMLRYTERIYRQMLYWVEIRDSVSRLQAMGMAESGMLARMQATEDPAIHIEYRWLRMLGQMVARESARAVKEEYAGGWGKDTTERHLQMYTMESLEQERGPNPWNEHVRFTVKPGSFEDVDPSDFDLLLSRFCLASDQDLPTDLHILRCDIGGPAIQLMTETQMEFEKAALHNKARASQMSTPLKEAIAEWSMTVDLTGALSACFANDYHDPRSSRGIPKNKISPTFLDRRKSLEVDLYSFFGMICIHLNEAMGILCAGEPLYIDSLSLNTPLEKPVDYSRAFLEDDSYRGKESTPLFLLEYGWLRTHSTFTSIEGRNLYKLYNVREEMNGKSRWCPKPKSVPIIIRPDANIGLPLSSESLTTSGHAYRVFSSPSPGITSKLGRATTKNSEPVQDDLALGETPSPQHPVFPLNRALMKTVGRLFSTWDEEGRQGKVSWKDIVSLMKRINFRVDEVGGSVVRFVPPDEAGGPMLFHRPHPEPDIHAIRYRAFGKKLNRKYGMTSAWFSRASAGEQ